MVRVLLAGLGLAGMIGVAVLAAMGVGGLLGATVVALVGPAIGAEVLAVGPAAGAVSILADQAAAAVDTVVLIPWGDMLAAVADQVGAFVLAVLLWLLRRLPGQVVAMLQTLRVEQLLDRAIAYGINATRGAVAGRTLSVDVGNRVLAEALGYVLPRAPGWLLRFVGGERRLAEMIWSRLDLDADASAEVLGKIPTT